MICETCSALISRQEIASTLLYRATRELARLAGQNQPDLFIAARRECAAYREECIRNSIALHTHRETGSCTSAKPSIVLPGTAALLRAVDLTAQ